MEQKNNPLHGIKLEQMITELYEKYGWESLGDMVKINSFYENPSIKSSLNFLRKMPWARAKVEKLYFDKIASKKVKK